MDEVEKRSTTETHTTTSEQPVETKESKTTETTKESKPSE